MPLYDYDCANCGQRFEVLRGVHADEPSECPLCGGGPIKKAFATPAIHFKGSGWAKKERRATSSPGVSKAAGDGGSGSGSGSAGESSSSGSDGSDSAAASKGSSNGSDGSSSSSGGEGGASSSTSSDAPKKTTASTSKAKGD